MTKPTKPDGPDLLAAAITLAELPKRAAAKRAGVSPTQLSYFLHRRRVPTIRQAARIQDALGVPMRSWV